MILHSFSAPFLIPIEYCPQNVSILVVVCSKCGLQAVQNSIDYNNSLPECSGYSDQSIPTRYDILNQYANNFKQKNKEALAKYDQYLTDLHAVNYKKLE